VGSRNWPLAKPLSRQPCRLFGYTTICLNSSSSEASKAERQTSSHVPPSSRLVTLSRFRHCEVCTVSTGYLRQADLPWVQGNKSCFSCQLAVLLWQHPLRVIPFALLYDVFPGARNRLEMKCNVKNHCTMQATKSHPVPASIPWTNFRLRVLLLTESPESLYRLQLCIVRGEVGRAFKSVCHYSWSQFRLNSIIMQQRRNMLPN